MNFLIDMNLPASWTDFLTGAGHTAVDWSDEGPPDASDREVMAWAADRNYTVLTAGLEKSAILATGAKSRPGVIVLACNELTPDALGFAVLAAIHDAGEALAAGDVISVEPDSQRAGG